MLSDNAASSHTVSQHVMQLFQLLKLQKLALNWWISEELWVHEQWRTRPSIKTKRLTLLSIVSPLSLGNKPSPWYTSTQLEHAARGRIRFGCWVQCFAKRSNLSAPYHEDVQARAAYVPEKCTKLVGFGGFAHRGDIKSRTLKATLPGGKRAAWSVHWSMCPGDKRLISKEIRHLH